MKRDNKYYNALLMSIFSLFLYKFDIETGGSWRFFTLCIIKNVSIFYLYISEAKQRIVTNNGVQYTE